MCTTFDLSGSQEVTCVTTPGCVYAHCSKHVSSEGALNSAKEKGKKIWKEPFTESLQTTDARCGLSPIRQDTGFQLTVPFPMIVQWCQQDPLKHLHISSKSGGTFASDSSLAVTLGLIAHDRVVENKRKHIISFIK